MQIWMFRHRQHDNENGKIMNLIFLMGIVRKLRHAFLLSIFNFNTFFYDKIKFSLKVINLNLLQKRDTLHKPTPTPKLTGFSSTLQSFPLRFFNWKKTQKTQHHHFFFLQEACKLSHHRFTFRPGTSTQRDCILKNQSRFFLFHPPRDDQREKVTMWKISPSVAF